MRETQKMNVRIIGDIIDGKRPPYIDIDLDVLRLDFNHKDDFNLVSYPDEKTIQRIKTEVCKNPDCTCEEHDFFRMRDIYNDGDIRLEIPVMRAKD